MSVINKMLRDLDARRVEGALPGLPRETLQSGMQGTVSVPSSMRSPFVRLGRWLVLGLVLLLAGITVAWYLGLGMFATPSAAPLVAIVEPPPAAPVPLAPVPEPVTIATEPVAGTASEAPPADRPAPAVSRQTERPTETATAGAPAGPVAPLKARAEPKRVAPRTKEAAVPAGQAASPVTAPAPALASSVPPAPARAQPRQTAAQEALAQAQALWNAGSREGALELIREAVGVVERTQPVDVALLSPLVREQARMELALGRPGAVLALLSRLEPLLSEQADLWAVRGNAAQRLGRHEESVQAYLSALQLRPGEARWMLGAAVSLAALGRTAAAAQQAEQARALGPISPEVLTYLRQAGVPLP